ncbi:polysaccharide pyruvyl transferase family protein [Glutamicibacter arilaitensis]|uniref:polysaccharide pyruvyl transferase family protein n=1 Tax=Glutamicibacter arilaitensis TaxID=256701 RepID=UPI003F8DA246
MKDNAIGVMGCLPNLPETFPITTPENSGNMVHANAPLLMFPNSVYSNNPHLKLSGNGSFRPFINNSCSHLIVTLANMLTLGREDGSPYARFQRALEQYDKPIVVFGLGVQSNSYDLENATLPKEAIELLQFLSQKATLLGVRGEYTKQVVEKLAGVKNAYVTGCPSLYSRPEMISKLRTRLREGSSSKRAAGNITNLRRKSERELLSKIISSDSYLVEPVSRAFHQYYVDVMSGLKPQLPYSMKPLVKEQPELFADHDLVPDWFSKYYRLFRDLEPWKQFNQEHVRFTFGTRFHVNMNSILSGVPALWLTHDSRTRELVEFANFPHLPLESVADLDISDIEKSINYEPFFDGIHGSFDNFNNYLSANGLPQIKFEF